MSDINDLLKNLPADWTRIGAVVALLYFGFLAVERIFSNPRILRRRKEKLSDIIALTSSAKSIDPQLRRALDERVEMYLFEEAFGIRAETAKRRALIDLEKQSEGCVSWDQLRFSNNFLFNVNGGIVVKLSAFDVIQYVFTVIFSLAFFGVFLFGVYIALKGGVQIIPYIPQLAPVLAGSLGLFIISAKQTRHYAQAINIRFFLRENAAKALKAAESSGLASPVDPKPNGATAKA
jgi:hypothetical protein